MMNEVRNTPAGHRSSASRNRRRSALLPLLAFVAACSAEPNPTPDARCRETSGDCECNDPTSACDAQADGGSSITRPRDAGIAKQPDASGDSTADSKTDAGRGAPRRDGGSASDGGSNEATDAASSDSSAAQGDGDARTRDGAVEAGPSGGSGFVRTHGALRVEGNRVVDGSGAPIQLRGMSWFWSQWTDFYVAKNVDVMVDQWKATLVRAALGVENEGGYLQTQQTNVSKVRAVVDRAIERDIYVIIDWHDHHANEHAAQATAFFEEMAKAYGKQPHVIFEIYNEPMGVAWPVVKTYAEQMIRTIRATGSENLIIVGTPNWSQDVDIAASDKITSDDNVAYTLHFYADTHKQALRDKAKAALDRGAALFVTEWGTCSADGNGSINESETRTWLSFMKEHSISWANWALNDKAEACSAVQPAGGSVGPWRDDQLTTSGLLVKGAIL